MKDTVLRSKIAQLPEVGLSAMESKILDIERAEDAVTKAQLALVRARVALYSELRDDWSTDELYRAGLTDELILKGGSARNGGQL